MTIAATVGAMVTPEPDLVAADVPAVSARSVGKSIDGRPILQDLTFDIARGSFLTLLGANGAGKSTLLKILATLSQPTSGTLTLLGVSGRFAAAAVRAKIGVIGHHSMLYHDLTARENLVFFGRLYGVRDPVARADELLVWCGLASRAADAVKTFSRGMTQRLAIARALMHRPRLLLADEPFAGLDAPSSGVLQRMLMSLHDEGATIVIANHDIGASLALAQRAIVLRRGRLIIDQPTSELATTHVLREMSRS